MNSERIIDYVMLKTAAIVKIPEDLMKSDPFDFADWLKKQRPNSKIDKSIVNVLTGEILLEKGQKLTKYRLVMIPKVLKGERTTYYDKKQLRNDPREELGLSSSEFKKYYKIKEQKNGEYYLFRSDNKPLVEYDQDNLVDLIQNEMWTNYQNAEMYEYDKWIEDFKPGLRYYKLVPKKFKTNYVLDSFDDYYKVKYKRLKTFFESDKEEMYSDYDPDLDIPVRMEKNDKSEFSKDDAEVIAKWLKNRFNGEGVAIDLAGWKGKNILTDSNLMLTMTR